MYVKVYKIFRQHNNIMFDFATYIDRYAYVYIC